MSQFKAAWERFATEEANLTEFPECEAQAVLTRITRRHSDEQSERPAGSHQSRLPAAK